VAGVKILELCPGVLSLSTRGSVRKTNYHSDSGMLSDVLPVLGRK